MAFDASSQRLILFGGCRYTATGACSMVNDVWILDLSGGLSRAEWTQLSPAGVAPSVTTWGFEVGYDPASGRLLVLAMGTNAMELWALEDANGLGAPRWISLSITGTETPPLRYATAVAHDSDRNAFYMFGGLRITDSTALGDAWILENADGVEGKAQWRALPQAGPQPEARGFHSGVLDPWVPQMFIFAGGNNSSQFSDAWRLQPGASVTAELLIDELPSSLVYNVAGYLAQRQTLFFLGCRGGTWSCRFGAVWHLRLDNETEPFREIILPEDEDAPFDLSANRSSVYDAESDRLFFFSSGTEAGDPLDVFWVLSNASSEE